MHEQIAWTEQIVAWLRQNADALLIGSIVAAVIVAVMLALRGVGQRIRRSDPGCTSWRSVFGHVLARTSLIFMVVTALDTVASYAQPPHMVARTIAVLFIIVSTLQAAVWARELILGVISRASGDEDQNAIANARSVIRVIVSVTLFALAIIIILDNIGVNVTGLVAGLGIGGIAIGLAAQGIFADLFAALSILFDKPFKRGDVIQFAQTTGIVERIGLKTTRLRSLTGEQVVMANTKLLEQEIHNFAAGRTRRCQLPFGLIYQTHPDRLEKVVSLAKAAVETRKSCAFVRCSILAFGASSIDFELIFDSRNTDAGKVASDRTAVAVQILRSFAEHGLEFAYPTQTSFTAAPDGKFVLPYPQVQQVVPVDGGNPPAGQPA